MKSSKGKRSEVSKHQQSSGDDNDREKMEATIFLLHCQGWITKQYTEEIRNIYLNPLQALFDRKKKTVESISKSVESSSNLSSQKAADDKKSSDTERDNFSNMDKVAEKLQQALKTLQRSNGEIPQSYRPVAREKTVSLADCCALFRLKSLLEAMQELSDIQTSIIKWFDANKTGIEIHKKSFKNLLTNALTNFEMTQILTELFAIKEISRKDIQKMKPSYAKYIRPSSNFRNIALINKPPENGNFTKEFIKKLEGQINNFSIIFRTIVYEIAKNLGIIIETIVANVKDHHLEVNTKQVIKFSSVAMIIDNLPPRYRFSEPLNHLAPFTKKLLANLPPDLNSGNLFGSTASLPELPENYCSVRYNFEQRLWRLCYICERSLAKMASRNIAWKAPKYFGVTVGSGRQFIASSSAEESRKGSKKKFIDLSVYPAEKIRNFGIVAHVDHGKSTLADRILELTGVIGKNDHANQMLDKLQVERDRGITVKAQSCSMFHKDYMLNLIDTPGHADFSFEVSRSLSVANGILLLVAANQGVQAQTVANFWLAFEAGLTIIPIINKIDLNSANVSRVRFVVTQMGNLFDFSPSEILHISAKNGTNTDKVLDAIIDRCPPPKVECSSSFRAHIFDSWYETYRGPVICVAVHEGFVCKGQKIRTYHTDCVYEVLEVGIMHPNMYEVQKLLQRLYAGQVGYLLTTMKSVQDALVGETLYDPSCEKDLLQPMALFTPKSPCIYASIYPVDGSDYNALRDALNKLALNDSSVQIQHDSSSALGNGFKIGFSGLLHMEVFCARLEQEYNADVTVTAPTVEYRAVIKDNPNIIRKRYNGQRIIRLLDASHFPANPSDVDHFLEPMIKLTVLLPTTHSQQIDDLCVAARGKRVESNAVDAENTMQQWRLPFAEVCIDFFERLKRITSGYATFNYEWDDFQPARIALLMIHVNDRPIYEFSEIVPLSRVKDRAKVIVQRLREEIPRQQYEVKIKATLGLTKKALTQTVIAPIKKDFTGRLKGNFGGGGWERLCKKLAEQNKGKERMKQVGQVQIPKKAFINVLRK
ncbi:unnamed protein product [Thelazia callipaeda]|uniref:Translation factor GUF1 homolog, mitochondrial n=1 Tax=Thelazia callipaeda TaxID=103827 RepID=A0A0N5CVQ0_THECL|nr:unnamed protein product [Thelazia callipaeda]